MTQETGQHFVHCNFADDLVIFSQGPCDLLELINLLLELLLME